MSSPLAASLKALGASTASGTGTALDLLSDSTGAGPVRKALKLALDVRAVSGTSNPSLKVEIETSPDDATWRLLRSATLTAAGLTEMVIGGAMRYMRARWTITGTDPSFTWSLTGEAHVVYCEPRDLISENVPALALEGIPEEQRWRACLTASSDADGYLGNAYTLPILAWDDATRGKVAELAVPKLFRARGCDPAGSDKVVFDTEAAAIKWFSRLADGKLSPGIVDSTEEVFEGGSVVVSSGSPRGW